MRSKKYARSLEHLKWDAVITLASIGVATLLVRAGVLTHLLTFTQGSDIIGAFISGIFFTSMFTVAIATVAFAELGNPSNIFLVSAVGAIGASAADLILFLFVRDSLIEDMKNVVKPATYKRFMRRFHGGFLRVIAPLLGGLIIASPLPDELGLALMGIARLPSSVMLPLSFVMNFLGIWAIISLASFL